jgi:hypothetical protein
MNNQERCASACCRPRTVSPRKGLTRPGLMRNEIHLVLVKRE